MGIEVRKNISDDPHRRGRRIDIGIPHHEFLEDIILNGSGQLGWSNALFFRGNDEECHDGNYGSIHRHGYRHLIQGDLIKEDLHVLYGINGYTRFSDIAFDARVVRIIAAVCGQVKGYRESFLSGGEIAAVEGVAFFGGGKASVLSDGPWPDQVHRGVRAP